MYIKKKDHKKELNKVQSFMAWSFTIFKLMSKDMDL